MLCAKFSPSGAYIASGDIRGNIRVWSFDNESHLCKLNLFVLSGPIRDISWDLDSKRLVVVGQGSKSGQDLSAKVIQWDTGVSIGELGQHMRNRVASCDFRKGRPMRIVTGGGDDSQCLFNKGPPFSRIVDGKTAEKCHLRGAVYSVRFSNDGSMIASTGTDKSVCLYDGKTMESLGRMENVHKGSIYACVWNSTDEILMTCGADGMTKLIHVEDRKIVHEWNVAKYLGGEENVHFTKVPIGGRQMSCAFLSGDIPISVAMNGCITILPIPTTINIGPEVSLKSDKIDILPGHQCSVSSFCINQSNGIMYTGDSNGSICQWNVDSLLCLGRVKKMQGYDDDAEPLLMDKVHRGTITGMVIIQDILLSIGWDDKIRLTMNSFTTQSIELSAQPNAIIKGTLLAVVLTVKGLFLFRNIDGISELIQTNFEPLSGCISVTDSTVYIGGDDNNIHIYSVVDGESLSLLETNTISEAHLAPVQSVCLSNDETKLASADSRDICLWNVADKYSPIIGRSRWCFHQLKIGTLSWSNDDTILASGSNDDSIYLWSIEKKMKRVHYAHTHRGGVTAVEFLKKSEDGKTILVSSGNDGCVVQWDVTDDIAKKFA